MKKIFLLIVFVYTSCTTVPNFLQEKDRNYPHFAVRFFGFGVTDQNSNVVGATAQDNINSRILRVDEKRLFFQAMDLGRFIVNTPEFEDRVLAHTPYIANGNFSGPNGTIQVNQPYTDKQRILTIVRSRRPIIKLIKQQLATGVVAQAELPRESGTDHFFNAYVDGIDAPFNFEDFFIGFNNRFEWTNPRFYAGAEFVSDEEVAISNRVVGIGFLANVFVHEVMHTAGFVHASVLNRSTDVAYVIGQIVQDLWSDPDFRSKYQDRFNNFTPYYAELGQQHLRNSTVAQNRRRSFNEDDTTRSPDWDTTGVIWSEFESNIEEQDLVSSHSEQHEHKDHAISINDEFELICTTDEQGRYVMKIVSKNKK